MKFDSERAKRIRANVVNGMKPLVSFGVPTYNQEEFVADAIKSAFAQTYQPLEIVISDDCSKDRTWEIIKKLVAEYKGPHRVILNRNDQNLGVTKHFELIMSLCNGDFYTSCSGDDIAFPEKVQIMVDRWAEDDYRPMVCYTNMYWMEEEGTKGDLFFRGKPPRPQTRKEFLRRPATTMPGASAGISTDVNDIFGSLNPIHSSSEDGARAIRGAMLDHLIYIDKPTMYWRKSGLWSGMVGKPEYNKKIYHDGMVKAEAVARQALIDAMQIKDYELIRAMTCWWNECDYRKRVIEEPLWKAPFMFLSSLRRGAKFWQLARWSYHALKYKWRYVIMDALFSHPSYAYMGDREIIYEEKNIDSNKVERL